MKESTLLKGMSFLISSCLWFTILCYRRVEVQKEIQLQPILPPGMMVINRIPSHIQFTLSGSRLMLQETQKRLIPIKIDLTRSRQETNGFSVTEDLLGELPTGVRVTSMSPPQVLIRLEEVVEKYIPVKPTLVGRLPSGFEIASIKAFPSKVAVTGPKGLVESIEYLGTEPFNIEGVTTLLEGNVDAVVDTSQGFQLSRDKAVRVRVWVRRVEMGK